MTVRTGTIGIRIVEAADTFVVDDGTAGEGGDGAAGENNGDTGEENPGTLTDTEEETNPGETGTKE